VQSPEEAKEIISVPYKRGTLAKMENLEICTNKWPGDCRTIVGIPWQYWLMAVTTVFYCKQFGFKYKTETNPWQIIFQIKLSLLLSIPCPRPRTFDLSWNSGQGMETDWLKPFTWKLIDAKSNSENDCCKQCG